MSRTITLTFSEDEAEILVDALDADLEGYVDAIKESRGNNRRQEVATYEEAAARITAVRDRVQSALG